VGGGEVRGSRFEGRTVRGGILCGMGQELDSQALQRLQEYYGEMSDGELLGIAAKPEDLTDMAREVMRGEMARRNLKVEDAPADPAGSDSRWHSNEWENRQWSAQTESARVLGSAPALETPHDEEERVKADEAWLHLFHDAFEVERACQVLDENEITFRLYDSLEGSRPRKGTRADGSGVALNLVVGAADRERAVKILREKMGLFPLQEVEEADPIVDDGTVSTVGTFGRRDDADLVAKALDEARIWHRVVANPEGSVANEDAWTLEVREVDLVRAGDVAVKAIRVPEG
jgi:hypothetical protein